MANTYEQQQAIDIEGTNIIVSAGAGSGKTAVLTQRVIRKISNGVDVNKLLVLTFTNEAANEMKKRIRDSIIKSNLKEQLVLLDSAYITTFDSFALSLVKKYSYEINVSPNISIIDKNIITIYKYQRLDEILENMYGDEKFDKMISEFCLKDDQNFKKDIISLSSKIDLVVDKDLFLNTYIEKYQNNSFIEKQFDNYMNIINKKIIDIKNLFNELQNYINDTLSEKLTSYLKPLFNGKTYDELVLFNNMTSIRFTNVDELGLSIKDELKENIEKIKELLRFQNKEEIISSIKSTYSNTKLIIEIIKKLDDATNKYKEKNNVYEFNDIAHMAISIVKNNKNIQNEVMHSFNEIMIDEYQDTSTIQEEFIKLISNNNVYMVGDIKQSIYRFRNANPYIFQKKYNQYGMNNGGIKIDLLKNFRSREEVLFNINEIFNLIMDDELGNAKYLEEHNMIFGNEDYNREKVNQNNYLEIFCYDIDKYQEFDDYEKELFIISEDIKDKIAKKYQIYDKDTKKMRDLKYSDICIITDRNKYLEKYKKILEYHNIPSVIYMDQELTNNKVILTIKNLIALVSKVAKKEYDNHFKYLYTSVARSFIFEYDDDKIYKTIVSNKILNDNIIKMCQEIDLSEPLVNIINNILIKFNIYEKLTNLYNISEDIIRISNLIDIADNLSGLGYSIDEFINYLDEVDNKGLSVKYLVNTGNQDAVKIMNIHKSKGLEFSLCYFTGMKNKFTIKELNESILFNDKLGIVIPYYCDTLKDTILKDIYKDDFYKAEISEKIRLFYVALTRCREKMIIICPMKQDQIIDKSSHLVDVSKRLKYRTFLDIINSLAILEKYFVFKEANYTHEYDDIKLKTINKNSTGYDIIKKEINITYQKINENHFSKENYSLLDKDSIASMKYGENVHAALEYADLHGNNNKIINKLFTKISKDYIHEYREYEFKYTENNISYHGIIDLMLEYDNYINIIDYKLKNINDIEYIKQLNGYKRYIERISNKKVKIYLYSIIEDELKEVN